MCTVLCCSRRLIGVVLLPVVVVVVVRVRVRDLEEEVEGLVVVVVGRGHEWGRLGDRDRRGGRKERKGKIRKEREEQDVTWWTTLRELMRRRHETWDYDIHYIGEKDRGRRTRKLLIIHSVRRMSYLCPPGAGEMDGRNWRGAEWGKEEK